jgi:endonuclease YncB( thermonuclease family)
MMFKRFFLLLFLALGPCAQAGATEFVGTVTAIQDGDTFDLAGVRIRLCGIDAPERGEAGSSAATAALRAIVSGQSVRCIQVGGGTACDGRSAPTNRGRVVAQCFVGDQDIAASLVRNGHACDWIKFSGGYYSSGGVGSACP